MQSREISPARQAVLDKIKEKDRAGLFNEPVEVDPPATVLLPKAVDYLCEKPSSKIKRWMANLIADCCFLRLIKKGTLIVDGVTGLENLSALQDGAVLTCNHFSPFDNYVLFHCIRKHLPKKYLYKVIREGNYTGFRGLYGFFFRHCNTLPLSSNRRTMINFTKAVNTLLKNGETVLIYPEQEMWWNYKKPRPLKTGAFKIAKKAGVPVVPAFITMQDDGRLDENGYPLQRHTVHILPAVYPDGLTAEEMLEKTYQAWKEKYEEVYGLPLVYERENKA